MSQYLNLEKPTENDLNWGDAVNRNTDKIDAECSRLNTELGTKAPNGHTHNFNNLYAPINHNHNSLYASIGHTHTGFAVSNHTHPEIAQILSRLSLAESRITTLFSDKADKSYVINLLQNFDHSVIGLTPQINLNGQGSNNSNLRVNAWLNTPAFLLEWHMSFKWANLPNFSNQGHKNTPEFTIPKPSANAPYWNGSNITGITIKIKCRNPFLNNDWSNEATLTDNDIRMYNFLDFDKLVTAIAHDNSFQTTLASVIITNPYMAEKLINVATHESAR